MAARSALPAAPCRRGLTGLVTLRPILSSAVRLRVALRSEVIRLRAMSGKAIVVGHRFLVLRAGGIVLGACAPG